jgi:hypothetical protein
VGQSREISHLFDFVFPLSTRRMKYLGLGMSAEEKGNGNAGSSQNIPVEGRSFRSAHLTASAKETSQSFWNGNPRSKNGS